MLFTGHSEHSIDAKLRLAIPAKYRNLWDKKRDGEAWYCVPWPKGRLLRLYTEAHFSTLALKDEGSLTPDDDQAELDAHFFSFAERLEMDSAGRIMIPKSHMELTGLPHDVVVVGARNRLEVRDRGAWLTGTQERFESLPSLVGRVQTRRTGQSGSPDDGR